MASKIYPSVKPADGTSRLQANASLDALRQGTKPGLSSKEIRGILKPYTKPDQFGHPTGSLRGG